MQYVPYLVQSHAVQHVSYLAESHEVHCVSYLVQSHEVQYVSYLVQSHAVYYVSYLVQSHEVQYVSYLVQSHEVQCVSYFAQSHEVQYVSYFVQSHEVQYVLSYKFNIVWIGTRHHIRAEQNFFATTAACIYQVLLNSSCEANRWQHRSNELKLMFTKQGPRASCRRVLFSHYKAITLRDGNNF